MVLKYSCAISTPYNFSVRFLYSVNSDGFNTCDFGRQLDYLRQINQKERNTIERLSVCIIRRNEEEKRN